MTTEQDVPQTVSAHERFTEWTLGKLAAPLNPGRVALDPRNNPYLEGWDVIAAANHYFGFDGWSSRVDDVSVAARAVVDRDRGPVEIYVYQARVTVTAGGVTHSDVGTSPTSDARPEAHETAIKGATTDGLKRALRQFGSQFGNDLYDKGRTGGGYVEPEQREAPAAARMPEQQAEMVPDAWAAGAQKFLDAASTKYRVSPDQVLRSLAVANVDELIEKAKVQGWNTLAASFKTAIEATPL